MTNEEAADHWDALADKEQRSAWPGHPYYSPSGNVRANLYRRVARELREKERKPDERTNAD